ncbi:MAG: hypothetical protein BroJett013_06790 [Alphaproteobacteria bacterium]|nr:MAG: hypothetical protein BroJett013_06790 [Alphaproteobacteria bacterium]
MIWLALALIVWAGVAAYGFYCYQRVKVADSLAARAIALCRRTESNNMRAAAERLDRSMDRFTKATGAHTSDNLKPPAPPSRPHFGFKPHVVTNNDNPEGAA